MNERIRELADKIWADEYWINPNTDRLLSAQLNKFAELIVRECADVCEKDKKGFPDSDSVKQGLADMIKEHFGVEE